MKRKTIVIICAIIAVVFLFGLAGNSDSGSQPQEEEKPVEKEYGFYGFEGVYKSKHGDSSLWVDAYGYGILLDDGAIFEGTLVPVGSDGLSFKVGGVLITFNADKNLVAFGGFGGTVLHRDANF